MKKPEIRKRKVVYEMNNVMGSEVHKALEKVSFGGFVANSFDTEDEAIEALIEDKSTYMEYVILTEVYIA